VIAALLAAAIVGGLIGAGVIRPRPPELPDLGAVADFSLVERSGRPLSRADLLGKVWVADFFFTSCEGPCPTMTARMAEVSRALADAPEVRCVSFTMDPATDTPEVLSRYADARGASRERWLFATGPLDAIVALSKGSFKIGAGKEGGEIIHGTYFALVDAAGRLRGHYNVFDGGAEELARVVADARLLAAEGVPPAVPAWVPLLPHVNGGINATVSVLLVLGLALVKAKRVAAHKACMTLSLALSVAFLASYVILHLHVGATTFRGEGIARAAYFTILVTHMTLAATVPLLAVLTVRLAVIGEIARHRRLARWTFPIWLYVSTTGVLVYLFLYHWFPAPAALPAPQAQ
jgi:protein SCO1/2/putative membrane protein